MRVAELTGAPLADQVALALGWVLKEGDGGQGVWHTAEGPHILRRHWKPQEDWAQGGPLLAKCRFGFGLYEEGELAFYAVTGLNDVFGSARGPDHLTAACRAIVKAKFGETVPQEVPA